jgi:hypothetical protein
MPDAPTEADELLMDTLIGTPRCIDCGERKADVEICDSYFAEPLFEEPAPLCYECWDKFGHQI